MTTSYPQVLDAEKVGSYPATAEAGGGYVWDEVLEYRVWMYMRDGAEDLADGSDYYYPFQEAEDALGVSQSRAGAQEPLALVLQREYIDEPQEGVYVHRRDERITEWPLAFLSRPRRDKRTIPDFLAPDAPPNRLDILRGITARPQT